MRSRLTWKMKSRAKDRADAGQGGSSPIELVAKRLIRAVSDMTDGRPGQWRMLHDVAGRLRVGENVADNAAAFAVEKGWAEERVHSVCLTDAGRRLGDG